MHRRPWKGSINSRYPSLVAVPFHHIRERFSEARMFVNESEIAKGLARVDMIAIEERIEITSELRPEIRHQMITGHDLAPFLGDDPLQGGG